MPSLKILLRRCLSRTAADLVANDDHRDRAINEKFLSYFEQQHGSQPAREMKLVEIVRPKNGSPYKKLTFPRTSGGCYYFGIFTTYSRVYHELESGTRIRCRDGRIISLPLLAMRSECRTLTTHGCSTQKFYRSTMDTRRLTRRA